MNGYVAEGKARYPIQSSAPASVTDNGSTTTYVEEPTSYEIPRNIRAVKDARDDDQSSRTIVLCLDGTGDQFDDDNSNIVHIVSCLKKSDRRQVTYYQAGIGTYESGGLNGGVSAAMDMAVGSGLGMHVRDAYHFLMHTYKDGDKICIFGFSRGAYTARCLAGMVHKVGLLPPRNIAQIAFAYEFYKDGSQEGWKKSAEFKKTFCINVNIHYLGLFDSVSSVGIIPRQLPLSSTPTNRARYFRHAMALDERRAKFKLCRFQVTDWNHLEPGVKGPTVRTNTFANGDYIALPGSDGIPDGDLKNGITENGIRPKRKPRTSFSETEGDQVEETKEMKDEWMAWNSPARTGDEPAPDTDISEVWFLGAHADVGGGAVHNDERHKLSSIPLRWMIRQSFECNTGIIWKTKLLARMGMDVHTLWPTYRPLQVPILGPPPSLMEKFEEGLPPITRRPSMLKTIGYDEQGEELYRLHLYDDEETKTGGGWIPEQVEDYFDALSPMNDQLQQARGWWILEGWPVEYWWLNNKTDEWDLRKGMNMGMYRAALENQPQMHWTVRHRMETQAYKLGIRTRKDVLWKQVT